MHPQCIIASLWIVAGQFSAFEAFERKAARTMRRHGGCIEHELRPAHGASPDADPPFEVHVLHFPDRAAFEADRSDPAPPTLGPARAAAIARTSVLVGVDGASYND